MLASFLKVRRSQSREREVRAAIPCATHGAVRTAEEAGMQRVCVVVLLGEALDATRPGIRGTCETPSGTDQVQHQLPLPAASQHP